MLLERVYRAIESTGERPFASAVIACVRSQNHAFRDGDAKRFLKSLGPTAGTTLAVPALENTHAGTTLAVPALSGPAENGQIKNGAYTKTRAPACGSQGNLTSRDMDSISISLPLLTTAELASLALCDGEKTPPHRASRKAKAEPDRSWIAPLEADVAAIGHVEMRDLSFEERLLVARLHLARHANYRASEARNRNAAPNVAFAFAQMGSSKLYATMTVAEFFERGAEYREATNGMPFRNPMAIRAMFDPEAVAAVYASPGARR